MVRESRQGLREGWMPRACRIRGVPVVAFESSRAAQLGLTHNSTLVEQKLEKGIGDGCSRRRFGEVE